MLHEHFQVHIVLALIVVALPMIAILVFHHLITKKIDAVRLVVQSRLDNALATVATLKREVRRLSEHPEASTASAPDPPDVVIEAEETDEITRVEKS